MTNELSICANLVPVQFLFFVVHKILICMIFLSTMYIRLYI